MADVIGTSRARACTGESHEMCYGNRRWFVRRFTPAGMMVVFGLVVTACLGADTNLSTAYEPFVLLTALMSLSLVHALRPKPKLAIHRWLPRTASAGSAFTYRAVVTNKSKASLRG